IIVQRRDFKVSRMVIMYYWHSIVNSWLFLFFCMIKVESEDQYYVMTANDVGGRQLAARFFDASWLKRQKLIDQIKTGRGEVCFFSWQGRQFALRHYLRGGLVATVNKQSFLWKNLKNTRVYSELLLLDYMRANGLNVPLPIAGRVEKTGLMYRCAIITEIIPHATELHQILLKGALARDLWFAIGKSIKQMHDLNVCHDDINVKNILINDKEQIFLIDFDKCFRKPDGEWKGKNVARLKRSLDKQLMKHQHYAFNQDDWGILLQGYKSK
ncbi:MAG: 3-deoxy-D-manno-octulosonic acid kinase, partial [Pseudomonadota bacterium]